MFVNNLVPFKVFKFQNVAIIILLDFKFEKFEGAESLQSSIQGRSIQFERFDILIFIYF